MIHRLNDERYQRWQNLIAGFLIHASRGIVRHDGQHEYTTVPDAPLADIGAVRIITEWRGR